MKQLKLKDRHYYISSPHRCPFFDEGECPLNYYEFCGEDEEFPSWCPLPDAKEVGE
jgi:hypothetical protein